MSDQLQRILYVSRWSNGLGEDMGAALHRIVAASAAKNRLADITGLLVAHEGWFLQALEGPPSALSALIVAIGRDPRHRDLRVLQSGPDTVRLFGDWSMAGARLGPETEPLLTELGQLARFDGHGLDADGALQLLMAAAESVRPGVGLGRNAA